MAQPSEWMTSLMFVFGAAIPSTVTGMLVSPTQQALSLSASRGAALFSNVSFQESFL